MLRAFSLAVAVVVLVDPCQLKAAEPPAAPSPNATKVQAAPETELVKDVMALHRSVRIVRDLAEFNILNLRPQETGAWMVAEIRPGGSSGGLLMQGGYLKAETGEFVDNGIRPSVVVQVGGQWKRLDLLSGDAPREGRFQWKETHVERSFDRSFSIYDYYGVFTAANAKAAVICQFFANNTGAQQFASVTSIPDGWVTHVKTAYDYHVQHSADFANRDRHELGKLAVGENPFIALTAIRQLFSRSTTADEMDQLADLIHSLPKYRQAVLTFWLLKGNHDTAQAILAKSINRTKSAAELRGIALGLESCIASHGQATFFFDPGPGRNLQNKIIQRWQRFNSPPADEEPWKIWQKILAATSTPEDQPK